MPNDADQDLGAAIGGETLDPDDWQAFSIQAHRALDAALEHIKAAGREQPWRPLPDEARAEINRPLPRDPSPFDEVLDRTLSSILPYPTGNAHARFWGWVMGNGTPDAMVADMLASAMNPHLAGYDQSASAVELRVIDWMKEIMRFPSEASGVLVSGGTMANMIGLAVARREKAGFDVRGEGLAGGPLLRVYGSSDTHSWAEKCCDVLGLGRAAFRRVDSDREGRIDLAALRAAIRADRARGERPICVIGNAGTVDAGAIDDLEALADLCEEEDLWLHVDGAFGALLAFSPQLSGRLAGLERVDSLAFDLHKWGYLPYELGCVLVRDGDAHSATFRTRAKYLEPPGRGIQPDDLGLADLSIQLSRGFRALKVWMALETHGTLKIGRRVEANVAQAQHLASRVRQEQHLELLGPAPLNIVCFRYRPPGSSEEELRELNREILLRIQEDGVAIPSSTERGGRFALRVAITNHRTQLEDIDVFLDAVLELGQELSTRHSTRLSTPTANAAQP
ncbi:MAG: pyridoxal-dependent decarboxylase [Acidobacteriota bacterium]